MNDKKRYEKKIETQSKLIARQSEQINDLKSQIENLKMQCAKKDEAINSVSVLKEELIDNVKKAKQYTKEYKKLIEEVRKMKDVINVSVFKGRWRLVKFLIK